MLRIFLSKDDIKHICTFIVFISMLINKKDYKEICSWKNLENIILSFNVQIKIQVQINIIYDNKILLIYIENKIKYLNLYE